MRLIDDHADFFNLVDYPADMNGYDHDEVMQVAHELYFHGNKQIHTVDELIQAAPSLSDAELYDNKATALPEILRYIVDLFDLSEKWVRRSCRLSKKAPVDYAALGGETESESESESEEEAPVLRRSSRLAAGAKKKEDELLKKLQKMIGTYTKQPLPQPRRSPRLAKKQAVDYKEVDEAEYDPKPTIRVLPVAIKEKMDEFVDAFTKKTKEAGTLLSAADTIHAEFAPLKQKIAATNADIKSCETKLAAARADATKLYTTKLADITEKLRKEISTVLPAKGPAGIMLHLMFEQVECSAVEEKVNLCSTIFKHIMNYLTVPLATHPNFRATCRDRIEVLSRDIDENVAEGKVSSAACNEFKQVAAAFDAYLTHVLPHHVLYSTTRINCPCTIVSCGEAYDPDNTKSDPDR